MRSAGVTYRGGVGLLDRQRRVVARDRVVVAAPRRLCRRSGRLEAGQVGRRNRRRGGGGGWRPAAAAGPLRVVQQLLPRVDGRPRPRAALALVLLRGAE